MTEYIVTLTIDDDCFITSVHRTVRDATITLAEHCRNNWPDHLGKIPADDAVPQDVCDAYFERDDGDLKFCGRADIMVHRLDTLEAVAGVNVPPHIIGDKHE